MSSRRNRDGFGRGSVLNEKRCAARFSWKGVVLHAGPVTRAIAGYGVCEDLSFERKEVISMGWWRTGSGGIIGDGPANVIEEFDERYWLETTNIPSDVRARINACYREDFDREPTEQELRDLLEFCGTGPEKD